MEVKVFNNLTRKKEPFKTIKEGEVLFYSCGPTTYDFLHVGNARALVVGDLFHRVLKVLGYKVNFVRNFTDVDDKIIDRANERGVDALEHAEEFVQECLKDMDYLGMEPASSTPKVSETMDEIIKMIEEIIANGYGYVVNGEVLYDVPKFEEYGKLSKKKLEDLQHGIRVEVEQNKKHPSDFVLWKPAKEGEPAWDSPWGKGRPGWHIECSAMARKHLGTTIDLHHGGVDLMFPHHENEIAQSEAANGEHFCTQWCHNEFLNFGTEKMSKSLGNVVTIRKFCETYGGEVLRQILCSAHYRSKMEWSEEVIERAIKDVERIHLFTKNLKASSADGSGSGEGLDEVASLPTKIKDELANDFNLPGAMAHFFSMIRQLNRDIFAKNIQMTPDLHEAVSEVISLIQSATGLVHDDVDAVLERLMKARKELAGGGDTSDAEIDQLVAERTSARANKDWGRADEIRDILNEKGIVVKDNPDGTVSWSYK